jgi:hypothetical protein
MYHQTDAIMWQLRYSYLLIALFIIFVIVVLSCLLHLNQSPPVVTRIIDRCPAQHRPAQMKYAAVIQKSGNELTVVNNPLLFSFSFSDSLWRFEENTLQDFEEPISTPGYYYSFLLTYKRPNDLPRRASVDIRLLVYPSFCNTTVEWANFYLTQGWLAISDLTNHMSGIPWTVLTRTDNGRKTQLYLTNNGVFQYAFYISLDSMSSEIPEKDISSIVDSFQLIEKETGHAK